MINSDPPTGTIQDSKPTETKILATYVFKIEKYNVVN